MKTNVPVKKQPVEAQTQPPDLQRRINAGWLRLWRAVYPNTPPPGERERKKAEGRMQNAERGKGRAEKLKLGKLKAEMGDRSREGERSAECGMRRDRAEKLKLGKLKAEMGDRSRKGEGSAECGVRSAESEAGRQKAEGRMQNAEGGKGRAEKLKLGKLTRLRVASARQEAEMGNWRRKGERGAECGMWSAESQDLKSKVQGLKSSTRRPAAVEYLSRFLCVGYALALMVTGCAGPRALKGGKVVTTRRPGGVVEQALVQSENPAQATKQDQERVKVRTYTVPAGSRVEQSQSSVADASQTGVPTSVAHQPSTLRPPPEARFVRRAGSAVHPSQWGYGGRATEDGSTTSYQAPPAFILSAPMPVVEREETRARTELGAAQKDTARELGAKLSSLKGIVWVGAGLFVFGLASLVWPPLKVVIASVTTSAALTMGGLALMVLPSLVVGNELLILGGVAVGVGGWFLAHRHGELRGVAAANGGHPNGGGRAGRS